MRESGLGSIGFLFSWVMLCLMRSQSFSTEIPDFLCLGVECQAQARQPLLSGNNSKMHVVNSVTKALRPLSCVSDYQAALEVASK